MPPTQTGLAGSVASSVPSKPSLEAAVAVDGGAEVGVGGPLVRGVRPELDAHQGTLEAALAVADRQDLLVRRVGGGVPSTPRAMQSVGRCQVSVTYVFRSLPWAYDPSAGLRA